MSHDSGFRRGGQDFTHRPPRQARTTRSGARPHDRAADARFHQHERQLDTKREQAQGE